MLCGAVYRVRQPWPSRDLPTAVQRQPWSERVHVVPPVHDLPVLDRDDRDEPVIVRRTRRHDLAVHRVLEDDDAPVLRAVHDEPVGRFEPDVVSVAGERTHQAGATSNHHRPTREVVYLPLTNGGCTTSTSRADITARCRALSSGLPSTNGKSRRSSSRASTPSDRKSTRLN